VNARVASYIREKVTGARGLNDQVGAADHVKVSVSQAPKVICVSCGRHIYYVKNSEGSVTFAPTENYQVRVDNLCPACGRPFMAYLNNSPVVRTDQGFM